jgi:hypothetical protein
MKHPGFPLLLLLLGTAIPSAFAKDTREYTQFGHDIRIAQGEKTAELTCFGCSIYVSGEVAGDVTAFSGNIVIQKGGSVGGDLTVFLGDVRLSDGSNVGGDLTTFGGSVRRQPGAAVGGDTTTFQGQAWIWVIFGLLGLFLAAIVGLVVWLIQRRRPAPVFARAA